MRLVCNIAIGPPSQHIVTEAHAPSADSEHSCTAPGNRDKHASLMDARFALAQRRQDRTQALPGCPSISLLKCLRVVGTYWANLSAGWQKRICHDIADRAACNEGTLAGYRGRRTGLLVGPCRLPAVGPSKVATLVSGSYNVLTVPGSKWEATLTLAVSVTTSWSAYRQSPSPRSQHSLASCIAPGASCSKDSPAVIMHCGYATPDRACGLGRRRCNASTCPRRSPPRSGCMLFYW
ncbi:hypothetical protein BV20DRAFT_414064 [Pilatotrama ljubarskyi]|nr:hypothetical protein BV20DRAFT_414064 [Pilatotrama ljubarskyi]